MITVVGSINMDLVVGTERFPKQGETVLGNLYTTVPGGKGANQAVAAARLGDQVHIVGAVGSDAFGTQLLDGLEKEQINTQGVKKTNGASGIANILLSEGDNRIIVVPGANHELTKSDIDAQKKVIEKSSLVILQLELPIPVVEYTLQLAKELGVPVILNPAPAGGFTEAMKQADFLTPNETEAEELFGTNWELELERYPNRMVVTLGKNGARYFDGDKHVTVEGFPTQAVDTTGAGDTFNGALAVALAEGSEFKEAVRFANAAASLSVEKFGAQGGMPNRTEVVSRMEAAK
ncbi:MULTISPECIES: ribokinase [unclassified Planococcus (in: firmicutes)]|uniref:ribokinase n=1 Tax=Planococcus TaxID=1372 RepID=UPI000C33263E|nr:MULTISPECIES: ribokinase [unclassified Planococcus (in: firmicutes)]AUD14748.1 ribokinase [Planococcus sp. MB-3u-03]PKG45059.1 ribokinase [Planococcus sp. Urea-trap-24]PKG87402.1 ribokinase [Planococcus sp. Urea-3u-39]PKH42527.1 ribokinase [Planococcus sp. MB-3u-09]